MRTKNRVPDTYYYVNNDYAIVIKLTLKFDKEQAEKTISSRKQKTTSFPKESVENADFHKLALNKIMTTRE